LPTNQHLDVNKTFENQRKLVNNTLIPVIQKSLNKKTFPVTDGILKHIIYERHRHRRESFLSNQRGANWKDADMRRKHANSRRIEVSRNRMFLTFYLLKKKLYLEARKTKENNR
jgi:hypothetical protein